jgi:hypothetical protein
LGAGNSAIIPSWQEIIKNDLHGFLEFFSHFTSGLVKLVNNMHKGLQPCLGMGFFHQFLDQLDAGEHHALASARNMWKQAMFDRVVLGAIGRVMGDADFNADLVGQGLQVLFEQVMSGIVTATAITLEQDRGGTGEARFPVGVPPMAQAITHKFTGIVAGADLNVTDILPVSLRRGKKKLGKAGC